MKREFSLIAGITMLLILLATPLTGCEGIKDSIPEEAAPAPTPTSRPAPEPTPAPVPAPSPSATKGEACQGYTIYSLCGGQHTTMIDMNLEIVHEWSINGNPAKMLPDGSLLGRKRVRKIRNASPGNQSPHGGRNFPDAIEFIQVSWDGKEEWSFSNWDDDGTGIMMSRQHHDYQREGNPVGYYAPGQEFIKQGRTLILARENKFIPAISEQELGVDVIYEVDWNGNFTGFEWHATDHFEEMGFDESAREAIYKGLTYDEDKGCIDWLHVNSMSLLGQNPWYDETGDNRFNPENIIISSRNANFIAIISRATGNIVWRVGPDFSVGTPEHNLGQFVGQHHAHMIPKGLPGEGNILVFDNGGRSGYGGPNGYPRYTRNFSRVIEFNPVTLEIVWQYGAESGDEMFFSRNISSAQRLPNGNTLITDGANGRIFEVTPDKEIVWEFIPPVMGKRGNAIYRAYRIPPEWVPGNPAGYQEWATLFFGGDTKRAPSPESSSAPASSSASAFIVVDTGQNKCYGNTREIPCPQPGEPFYGQDAQYQGTQFAYQDNGDGTVTDLNTGLMWQKSPPSNQYTWAEAVTYAENLELAGYADWRMPTIKELYSLVAFYGNIHTLTPYIDIDYFDFKYPDTSQGYRIIDAQYWSSNKYVGTTMRGDVSAFGFNFADGRIKSYPTGEGGGPTKRSYIRCVRGGNGYGENNFVDNGDGTITDLATGLMWMQADSGTAMNWEQALRYAENLKHADYDDWRLPNAKELQSIVDYARAPDARDPAYRSAAIDPIFDLTETESWFWTGTTHNDNRFGIYVCFGQALAYDRATGKFIINAHGAGAQRSDPKRGDPAGYPQGLGPQADEIRIYNYVRCVRDAN